MHKEIKGPVNGKSIADTDTAISTLPIMNGDSIVVALRLSSTSGLGNLSIAERGEQTTRGSRSRSFDTEVREFGGTKGKNDTSVPAT